jgi:tRNA 2-thiouridine synthesizing protein A
MSETVLDVQGLSCPLPVLKTNKALRSLPAGARLTVLATDPASVKDFRAFCQETGHALVAFSEAQGIYRFTLRKRDAEPPPPPEDAGG